MAVEYQVKYTPGFDPTIVNVSQNDVGRQFDLKIIDETGAAQQIPSGSTVKFVGMKPSGLGFTVNCTFTNSVVHVTTTDIMTDENGLIPAKVQITNGNTVIGTANVNLRVEKNPHPEGTIDDNLIRIIPTFEVIYQRLDILESSMYTAENNISNLQTRVGIVEVKADDAYDIGSQAATMASAHAVEIGGIKRAYDGTVYQTAGDAVRAQAFRGTDTTLTVAGKAADAKAAGDRINQIFNNIGYDNNNYNTFYGLSNFDHYGLNPDGTFLTSQQYRVSNTNPISFPFDITIHVESGFRIGYIPIHDGSVGSWCGWFTEPFTIPYGVSFIIQIARVTEITSEIADVRSFLNQIYYTSYSNFLMSIHDLQKNGSLIQDFNTFEHERGTITSTGTDNDNAYNLLRKIRSSDLVYLNKGDTITCTNNMRAYAVGVNLYGTGEYTQSGWITDTYNMPYSGFYRLQISLIGDYVINDKDVDKVCGWVKIKSNWFSGDNEIYKYFNDNITTGRRYAYTGELLNFNKTTYNITEVLPLLPSPPEGSTSLQACAYYNGVMFNFYSGGYVSVLNYDTGTLIAEFETGTDHGNSASFSNEFYDSTDEFPLVYVSSDNANNDIFVVRITRSSAAIIRTLRLPVEYAGYHGSNFGLDIDNNLLWTTGYKINDYQTAANNNIYLCSWDLSSLTANNDNTYTPELRSKDTLPFIDTCQDEKVFNGILYVISSNPYASLAQGRPSRIYAISLNGRRISAIIQNFIEPIRDHELEGLALIERGNKYILAINAITGRRFELEF